MSSAAIIEDGTESLQRSILEGHRRSLSKAITLIESIHPVHRERAQRLLESLLPHTGRSLRIGITGVPGVGKSTFIEALGLHLIKQGHRVAVLAVDPSSSISGGSILGDKTRMEQLSQREEAFIRPSPAGVALGGVADKTREALLLCEAAGFDIVIVETVGVGQSETAVAAMTDVFVLLQLPNAGDDLQAIKKGVVELADIIVFNKADLDPTAMGLAIAQMRSALAMLHASSPNWQPPVLKTSALANEGIADCWQAVEDYRRILGESGELAAKRRHQSLAWMWQLIDSGLRHRFREHPGVKASLPEMAQAVEEGSTAPTAAAHRLLNLLNRNF